MSLRQNTTVDDITVESRIMARIAYFCAMIFLLISSFIYSTQEARADCFSFLPYGYNGYFVHLPINKEFCVATPDGEVYYKTNEFGARVIIGESKKPPIYAFGESQLIEIFPREKAAGHILWGIYGKRDLHLHGAPNNGPNETLAYIDYIFRNKKPAPKTLIIGFNLGFDLFRIIPGWRISDRVPHDSNDISFMMKYPTLYGLINFGRAVAGDKFEFIDRPEQNARARHHFDKFSTEIVIDFIEWLKNLGKLKKKYNFEIDMIFFDAYWSYDIDKTNKYASKRADYTHRLVSIVCKGLKYYSMNNKTLVTEYSKRKEVNRLFTYTLRHFKDYPKRFQNVKEFCVQS